MTKTEQRDTVHPFAGLDIPTLIEMRARQRADHPMLIWSPFEGPAEIWSYDRFCNSVARFAAGLHARGIREGDRVLVHLENSPETLIARFAITWLGGVAVLSNAKLAGPELAQIAPPLGVRWAITQPKLARAVEKNCPGLELLVTTATDSGSVADRSSIPAAAERFEALFLDPMPRRAPDPEAPAMILFTTGSTGRPKAVLWTHANVLWAGKTGALQQGLRAHDVYQVHLPLFHVVGFTWSMVPAFYAGATILLQPRFSTSRFWPTATTYGATVSSHAGTDRLLRDQPVPDHQFRQWLFASHDPVRDAHFRVKGVAGWGMTEMVIPAIASDASLDQRSRSIGRPWPGYEVRIEREDGTPARPGETGHLLIGARRGLSMFREYVGNPSAMAEAFDEEGYFRTGDLVMLSDDGWITFSDRAKDMIKVGGEGVSASEIEAAILSAGGVHEVAVVSRPDPIYGEVPVAYVVFSIDSASQAGTTDRIMQHCRTTIAKFKVPREIVSMAELPKIGNNKINRVALRTMASAISREIMP